MNYYRDINFCLQTHAQQVQMNMYFSILRLIFVGGKVVLSPSIASHTSSKAKYIGLVSFPASGLPYSTETGI